MESIRRILLWRLHNLSRFQHVPPPRNLHLLPPASRDPFGRPIVIMNDFASIDQLEGANADDFRKSLKPTIERLRRYLTELNEAQGKRRPVLQYVVLLDLEGVSIQHIVRLF
jgi:hypothetical protein